MHAAQGDSSDSEAEPEDFSAEAREDSSMWNKQRQPGSRCGFRSDAGTMKKESLHGFSRNHTGAYSISALNTRLCSTSTSHAYPARPSRERSPESDQFFTNI